MNLTAKTAVITGAGEGIFSPGLKKSGCVKSELNIKYPCHLIQVLKFDIFVNGQQSKTRDKLDEMKKLIIIAVILVISLPSFHWLIWRFFGVGLPAFFPYRNRINRSCILFSGGTYKPPWFNLIYKYDKTCEETNFSE